jgi:DNA replication protein DnaC
LEFNVNIRRNIMDIKLDEYIPGTAARPCPECGQILADHDDAKLDYCWIAMQSKKRISESIKDLVSSRRISPRFGESRFDVASTEIIDKNVEAWERCEAWLDSDFTGLYLWGKPGTGKTYAARCILYHAMAELTATPMEVTAYDLIARASQNWDNADYLRRAETSRFLLIDDIDKVDWRPKDLSYLWALLNTRAENLARTIITTNVSPQNFRDVFSTAGIGNDSKVEATLQRLHPIDTVEFVGGSIRGLLKGSKNETAK